MNYRHMIIILLISLCTTPAIANTDVSATATSPLGKHADSVHAIRAALAWCKRTVDSAMPALAGRSTGTQLAAVVANRQRYTRNMDQCLETHLQAQRETGS